MGRKSTKENKSIYQTTREELGLTREKAAEILPGFSPERIEKIENERVQIRPEDVKMMAEAYKAPGLCNYYCSQECPIGRGRTPRVESKNLVQIVVETLNGINRLSQYKDRMLEIAEDGALSADEYEDFGEIKETLDKLQVSVSTMQLWLEEQMAKGELDADSF
ncbi:MAG: helix-turn-helix domain-containing protein [Clostridia bacterium]|nr:helix-turn-helix domain-containing protein [Clostridia bacterium]